MLSVNALSVNTAKGVEVSVEYIEFAFCARLKRESRVPLASPVRPKSWTEVEGCGPMGKQPGPSCRSNRSWMAPDAIHWQDVRQASGAALKLNRSIVHQQECREMIGQIPNLRCKPGKF
jgi:hypothetical protein